MCFLRGFSPACFNFTPSHFANKNFINTALTRATQRTQRFIRWVRVWIYKQAPWRDSIARLREVWAINST